MESNQSKMPAIVLAAVLSACTHMPDDKVYGLPDLAITEHVVDAGEIFQHCKSAMSWWQWALLSLPMACATLDFERRTCDIYVAANSSPDTVEHERRHCRGYDHGGRIQSAYDAWLEAQPPAAGLPAELAARQLPTPSAR